MRYLLLLLLAATSALAAEPPTPEQERKQLIEAYRAQTIQRNDLESALIRTQVANEAAQAEIERLKKLCGEKCETVKEQPK